MLPRSSLVPVLAALSLVLTTTSGRAGPVRLTASRGGPDDVPAATRAIEALVPAMAPCFRRAAGPVRVALEVGADGEVGAARAEAGGKAAQCAAGLLLVASLPAGRASWSAVVELDTTSLEQRLTAELAARREVLAQCQGKDPRRAGTLTLDLAIDASGAVAAAKVATSSGSKAIDQCAVDGARRLEVSAPGRSVRYQLRVEYVGGKGGGVAEAPGRAPTSAAEAGSVNGPLAAGVVQGVWDGRARPKVLACAGKARGSVMITFKIRGDGTVKNVTIKDSTLTAAGFPGCVDGVVRGLTFPAAAGETFVKLPVRI
ncbi:MAG: TonB family protein [Kofleriaceae bacterium]|nr:TonB family protein [Kofleriaceae bacterium]MBP9202949.1 TonB family protein [Kofleriaceae bacterium]